MQNGQIYFGDLITNLPIAKLKLRQFKVLCGIYIYIYIYMYMYILNKFLKLLENWVKGPYFSTGCLAKFH